MRTVGAAAFLGFAVVCASHSQFQPHDFGESPPLFLEQFDKKQLDWIRSEAKKVIVDGGEPQVKELKYDGETRVAKPTVYPGLSGDEGLLLVEPAHYYAISTALKCPIVFGAQPFVLQYEVKLQDGLECGGAYLKLFRAALDSSSTLFRPELLNDQTPYTLMFGPDRCGSTDKVHFIIQHLDQKTRKVQEKHMKDPPRIKSTKLSTLYGLTLRLDGTFTISINREKIREGNMLTDFDPPINPPAEIEDPSDLKPEDWVDEAKIPDPHAAKPADWDEEAPFYIEDLEAKKPDEWLEDEPQTIADPEAAKPNAWIDSEDGHWEAPIIANPKCTVGCGTWKAPTKKNPRYQGKWTPPLISNPAYRGEWKARKIPNPDFFEDPNPAKLLSVTGLGFEVWTMQGNIIFDNILITNDEEQAARFAEATWTRKYDLERLALEEELNEKRASDLQSSTETSQVNREVIRRAPLLSHIRDQAAKFIKLFSVQPYEAMLKYPVLALHSVFLTVAILYFTSILIRWIAQVTSGSSRRATSKAGESKGQAILHIQKSEKLSNAQELTAKVSSVDQSSFKESASTSRASIQTVPSRPSSPQSSIPRRISPIRPAKFSNSYSSPKSGGTFSTED